jgi:hypothetical protein
MIEKHIVSFPRRRATANSQSACSSVRCFQGMSSAWSWLELEYHSLYDVVSGIKNRMHVAQKFEYLLDTYLRPDGHRWTGQQLHEPTGGVVTRSYVTNLRKAA